MRRTSGPNLGSFIITAKNDFADCTVTQLIRGSKFRSLRFQPLLQYQYHAILMRRTSGPGLGSFIITAKNYFADCTVTQLIRGSKFRSLRFELLLQYQYHAILMRRTSGPNLGSFIITAKNEFADCTVTQLIRRSKFRSPRFKPLLQYQYHAILMRRTSGPSLGSFIITAPSPRSTK